MCKNKTQVCRCVRECVCVRVRVRVCVCADARVSAAECARVDLHKYGSLERPGFMTPCFSLDSIRSYRDNRFVMNEVAIKHWVRKA
ncbi:hypothetical protein DPMN_169800 [Dreissena polymorpha]|uniref:Uncharacterized protein n=1 Tax=Dreissena polymorpha TaxID=45954 RepID=A0A9D4DYD2_DREPO|nr:hypothetical protein DPMN_169800 [Dreissena polymorpha]